MKMHKKANLQHRDTSIAADYGYLDHGRPRADSSDSESMSYGIPVGAPNAPRSLTSTAPPTPASYPVQDPFYALRPANAVDTANRFLALERSNMAKPYLDSDVYGVIGGSTSNSTPQFEEECEPFGNSNGGGAIRGSALNKHHKSKSQQALRRPGNRDEFDGAVQTLPLPTDEVACAMDQRVTSCRVSLEPRVQANTMSLLTTCLSRAAFDWVARYQFPIPRMADRPIVVCPEDRTWNEWAYLIKRLATKRRVPARIIKDGHIKALVPTMENATIIPPPGNGSVLMMEDRHILQVISAGIQVTRLIQDGSATHYLLNLYNEVAKAINESIMASMAKSNDQNTN